jgi:hypothetical protein
MINYFIKDGDVEIGPLNIIQLKSKAITKDTLLWYAGLEGWAAAEDIFELKELFIKKPSRLSFPVYKFIRPGKKH